MCLLSSQQVNRKLNVKYYHRYRSAVSTVNVIQQVPLAGGKVTITISVASNKPNRSPLLLLGHWIKLLLCIIHFNPSRKRREKKKKNNPYHCDENSVFIQHCLVVVASCQQLPNLCPQCLRNSSLHQCGQSVGSHHKVIVPKEQRTIHLLCYMNRKQDKKSSSFPIVPWKLRVISYKHFFHGSY